MAEFKEEYLESCTGKNRIRYIVCKPDGQLRGIVQIVHGIAEHIDRYRPFMEFLADNGYAAVGDDHLGHGKSIEKPEDKGAFCEKDGWRCVEKDLVNIHDLMVKRYPGVKYMFFGHSMGSFLTRTFIIDHPDKYDMAVISGTGHQNRLLVKMGNVIANHEVRSKGYYSDGQKLKKLSMGGYLKKIKTPKSKNDWLSRDESAVAKFRSDPLCGFTAQAGLYRDMLFGVKYVTSPGNIKKMDKNKPVLFISGDQDPVGEYGKGVVRAYEAFKKAGLTDVNLLLYKGARHEMLNEINKDEVYGDILYWMEERMAK